MAYATYLADRLFDPTLSLTHIGIPRDRLIDYNTKKSFSELTYFNSHRLLCVNPTSLVVHIDGACRNNGERFARGAWGVYFGPGSSYNTWGHLNPNLVQTSTCAEIEALSQALGIISLICDHHPVREVVIASDSQFLVLALCQWIELWNQNHGIDAKGRPIAHYQMLKHINERITALELVGRGRRIKLWHIPRECNQEADALAHRAFI